MGLAVLEPLTGQYVLGDLHEVQRKLIQAEQASMAHHQARITSITRLFAGLERMMAETSGGIMHFEEAAIANDVIAKYMDSMKSHIYTAHPDARPSAQLEASVDRETRMLQRGIKMRTIYPDGARSRPAEREWARKVSAHGAEVRTMAPNYIRMLIIDERCAIISDRDVGEAQPPSGYIITHPGMVRTCARFYQFLWDRAEPWLGERARQQSGTVTTSRGREILRKLESGQTIDQIARVMGLSRGTINKEIKTLYAATNTNSHFALGAWWATTEERKLT
jgi:DNA-binding CsgD family transcriptional regulator